MQRKKVFLKSLNPAVTILSRHLCGLFCPIRGVMQIVISKFVSG